MSKQDAYAVSIAPTPGDTDNNMHGEQTVDTPSALALLRSAGVKGNQTQLTELIQRLKHNAVACQLLAAYLKRWYAGRLNGLDSLPSSGTESHQKEPITLAVVLAAFEHKLRGTSDLTLLYLLSLSDRPVAQAHMKSVFHSTLMERWLTRRDDYVRFLGPLGRLNEEHWHWVIENLRRLQLLEQPIAGQHDLLFVAEPIRRYFQRNLERRRPGVYLQATADMQKLSADTVVEFRQRYYNTPEIKTWISPELQAELKLRDPHSERAASQQRLKSALWKADELSATQQQLQALRNTLQTMKDQTQRLNQHIEAHQQFNRSDSSNAKPSDPSSTDHET